VPDRVTDFAAPIDERAEDAGFARIRAAEQTGRTLGSADFITGLERILGRPIARRAPGHKRQQRSPDQAELL